MFLRIVLRGKDIIRKTIIWYKHLTVLGTKAVRRHLAANDRTAPNADINSLYKEVRNVAPHKLQRELQLKLLPHMFTTQIRTCQECG